MFSGRADYGPQWHSLILQFQLLVIPMWRTAIALESFALSRITMPIYGYQKFLPAPWVIPATPKTSMGPIPAEHLSPTAWACGSGVVTIDSECEEFLARYNW